MTYDDIHPSERVEIGLRPRKFLAGHGQRVDGTLVETPVELVARVVDCVRVSLQLLLTGYS
mgnify:CR=1 FL=1